MPHGLFCIACKKSYDLMVVMSLRLRIDRLPASGRRRWGRSGLSRGLFQLMPAIRPSARAPPASRVEFPTGRRGEPRQGRTASARRDSSGLGNLSFEPLTSPHLDFPSSPPSPFERAQMASFAKSALRPLAASSAGMARMAAAAVSVSEPGCMQRPTLDLLVVPYHPLLTLTMTAFHLRRSLFAAPPPPRLHAPSTSRPTLPLPRLLPPSRTPSPSRSS